MRNLSEIIKEINQLKCNISNAKENFKNSNNELVKQNCLLSIKEWEQSLRVLFWVIETENTLTNK